MKASVPLPESICAFAASEPGSVLLETSRFDEENSESYLFHNPVSILTANAQHELAGVFMQMEEALAAGYFLAGFLAYEAGYALHGLPLHYNTSSNAPLAWFGIYKEPLRFNHRNENFYGTTRPKEAPLLQPSPIFSADEISLIISPERYMEKIEQIKEYIAAGATYQINFTNRIELQTTASPASLYLALSRSQPVSYGALLHTGNQQILSMSPELFFRIRDRHIITRPMKGTWPRGRNVAEDAIAALELQNDEKNRSEHLMIVDLLRNDLGRICTTGSIRVEDLFSVERYPTLLQMTSTVSGLLPNRLPWMDVFRSLFPSGSITGAPKLASMGIIRDIEKAPRGIYTGSIGYIAPDGDATFNVAIRTLVHEKGKIRMGVGGGIVIDSDPANEYAECQLKASFLKQTRTHELIETMRWDNVFVRLNLHMERLRDSCEYFGYPFDAEEILEAMEKLATTFYPLSQHRIRLTLDSYGRMKLSSAPLSASRDICRVTLASERTLSSDPFLHHKTNRRKVYDHCLATAKQKGFDDVLFLNQRGELTEGAISNIFLRIGTKLYTPALTCGVLPGIFRRYMLDTVSSAEEHVLTLNDLHFADTAYLCSSLRGMRRIAVIDEAAENSLPVRNEIPPDIYT